MQKYLLKSVFKKVEHGNFEVTFWDNETVRYGNGQPKVKLIFHEPLPASFNLSDPSLSFGEAYMDGIIDFEGSLDEVIRIAEMNKNRLQGLRGKAVQTLKTAGGIALKRKQRQNISHHYDLGNDFFSLWLDESLSYSCAYFRSPKDSLFQAQVQKIDHVLKKLNLRPGERLLDIGSGWGWLVIRAAKLFGVSALGITLSEEQWRSSQQRVAKEGLEGRVEVRLMDYLDLDEREQFDKIVSVGMFEHVGKTNLPRYMDKVHKLLRPGGFSLLHTITGIHENRVNSWMEKYIFPGGYVPSLRETVWLLPEYDFHTMHIESLRMHYAMTLDRWYENYREHLDTVTGMFDERFARMWGLFLQSCAASFRTSGLDIHQILFSKGLNNELPLTLEHVYAEDIEELTPSQASL